MDTKLKDIKYSKGAKITAAILVWLCIISACASGLFLIYNQDTVGSKSYFETNRFKEEFGRLVHNAVEMNVILKNEENIRASANEENVEEKQSGDRQVNEEQNSGEQIDEERAIKEKLSRLRQIKNRLSGTVNFVYALRNQQTMEVITNLTQASPLEFIQEQPVHVQFPQNQFVEYAAYYSNGIEEMLSDTPYEVYAAVLDPLEKGDVFYDDYMQYNKIKTRLDYIIPALIASVILAIIFFGYLVIVTGRREKDGEIVLSFIDSMYTDIYSLLVLIAAILSMGIVIEIGDQGKIEMIIIALIVLSLDVWIGMSYVLSMTRQIKNRQIFRNTLAFTLFNKIKALVKLCFSEKVFKAWILLLLLAYGGVNSILFAIALNGGSGFIIGGFLLMAFNAAAVYFTAKSLISLSQIMEAAREISTGNLDYTLDIDKLSISFLSLAENIQSIQDGMKKAVAEAVKGERMKTDLITNVSHDLKTPLTSIVNYVDLLKKEELNNEKAEDYVRILEEKSARLKQLIDDLVEASKASSGNLAVKAEKVDLHQLIMQACGEYEEKIKKTKLDIRINAQEKKMLVNADGKHMWRIVENLLSNVLKYSMDNSRVYINIDKNDLYGMLTIKNISAFPLNISPEQLTERFVRGDTSRSTEGSGLGLSIAQSLTNLQGGKFKIEIDGDLFKVTVKIPLWVEMKVSE